MLPFVYLISLATPASQGRQEKKSVRTTSTNFQTLAPPKGIQLQLATSPSFGILLLRVVNQVAQNVKNLLLSADKFQPSVGSTGRTPNQRVGTFYSGLLTAPIASYDDQATIGGNLVSLTK